LKDKFKKHWHSQKFWLGGAK